MTRPSYSPTAAVARGRRAHEKLALALVALAACGGAVEKSPAPTDAGAPRPSVSADVPGESKSDECTGKSCTDGFVIEIAPRHWDNGRYRFVIETENGSATCQAAMPFPSCLRGDPVRCEGTLAVLPEVVASGCVAPDENRFASIRLLDGPSHVGVHIFLDDALLAEETFAPSYRLLMPNGPSCAPTCRVAMETFRWATQ